MDQKLTLYDVLGRLVPGGFSLWGLVLLARQAKVNLPFAAEASPPTEAIVFVLIAYVAGLVAHILGDWLVESWLFKLAGKPSERFLSSDADAVAIGWIRSAMQAAAPSDKFDFGGETVDGRNASHRAFRMALSLVEDTSPKVQAVQAQYGLHRSLAAACIVLTVFAAAGLVHGAVNWGSVVSFGAIATLFCGATLKWGHNLVRCVFEVAAVRLQGKEKELSKPESPTSHSGSDAT
ncbi:MAG: hypothetical protein HZC36_11485 [Armatimonadetes bacterium]|nr:hypothetical protein [Armatimonadota bacterium]